MKRVWIGGILLAVLLTVGLLAGWAMDRGLCPGAEKLKQAGELAAAGRWEAAEEMLDDVDDIWEDYNAVEGARAFIEKRPAQFIFDEEEKLNIFSAFL